MFSKPSLLLGFLQVRLNLKACSMTPTTFTTAHVFPAGENMWKYLHRLLCRTLRRRSGFARGYQPARPGSNPSGSNIFFFLRRSRSPFFWVGSQQAGKTASVSATINTAACVADEDSGGPGALSAVVLGWYQRYPLLFCWVSWHLFRDATQYLSPRREQASDGKQLLCEIPVWESSCMRVCVERSTKDCHENPEAVGGVQRAVAKRFVSSRDSTLVWFSRWRRRSSNELLKQDAAVLSCEKGK